MPLIINCEVSLNSTESPIYITQLNSALIDLLLDEGNILTFRRDYKDISPLAEVQVNKKTRLLRNKVTAI